MGRWSRLAAPLLAEFAGIADAGPVLDAGCGAGSLAFAIAERTTRAQVVGIDPSPQYIAYANSVNRFPDRVRFETGDARRLRFGDGAFQSSLSMLVFNFIPDAAQAVGELRRVTKRGGHVAAAVWDYGDGMRMLRIFWDAAGALDPRAAKLDERHMPLCRAGELSQLWREAGLAEVREEPLEITMRFESLADYWDPFLLGQGPAGAYARSLAQEGLQALQAEVKRRLAPLAGGGFELAARAWAARGTA